MAIVASAHVLLAGLLLPAVPSLVRVAQPAPVSGMERVAETTVVPVVAEVITMFLFNDAAPPEFYPLALHDALPISLVILAVAVPLPNVVPTAVTVMVSV